MQGERRNGKWDLSAAQFSSSCHSLESLEYVLAYLCPSNRLPMEPSKASVYPAFIHCFCKYVVSYQLEHILERDIPKFPITGLRHL